MTIKSVKNIIGFDPNFTIQISLKRKIFIGTELYVGTLIHNLKVSYSL